MNVLHGLRRTFLLIASVIVVTSSTAVSASDQGQAAADEVSEASYSDFMDNWLYTHIGDSRGPSGVEHDLARDNIAFFLESYGLEVAVEPFTVWGYSGENVVATKLGTTYPSQQYVIGGHYDSVSNPGADDDASGIALVLEVARIVSQYESDYTIRFVAFDQEETGLNGSEGYVSAHAGDDILGMLQADMVAYDPNTNGALVYGRINPLKDAIMSAITMYSGYQGVPLTPTYDGWNGQSDHASFDAAGIEACLLIEGQVWNNPYYHTQQDNFEQLGNLNFPFAVRMTRSAVGWLVDAAGVQVPVDTLNFAYPNGRPEFVAPAGGDTMRVDVTGMGNETPEPGTGVLHYNTGIGWESSPMISVSPIGYDAVFPAADCGTEVLYYVSAEAVGGEVFTDPRQAPADTYSALATYGSIISLEDNFENDLGWTAQNLGASSGDWQRGVPVNDPDWAYAPAADSDGSGQCYLTQNEFGNTDVDGGAVRLTSPLFDLSQGGTIAYDYFLRLTNTDGGVDRLLVEINNNSGLGPWIEIVSHESNGGLGWLHHEIDEAALADAGVTPTAMMLMRFTANDADPQSIVEAGLDAFSVSRLQCCGGADGNMNGDQVVNGLDIEGFVDGLINGANPDQECHGDFDGLNDLDLGDIPDMVDALLSS